MKPLLPEVLEVRHAGKLKLSLTLKLPQDLLYFDGHFPNLPVLPAVVQIDWALHFGREYFTLPPNFQSMDRLKFRQVLMPEDQPELTLEFKPARGELEFAYATARGRHSSGHLSLG